MIHINSSVTHSSDQNIIELQTNGNSHQLLISNKPDGKGLNTNGGEILFLSIAICYTNDIYREAKKLDMEVIDVQIAVSGDFNSKPGSITKNIIVNVQVKAKASEPRIKELVLLTDSVAEIPNTLREGIEVNLGNINCISY